MWSQIRNLYLFSPFSGVKVIKSNNDTTTKPATCLLKIFLSLPVLLLRWILMMLLMETWNSCSSQLPTAKRISCSLILRWQSSTTLFEWPQKLKWYTTSTFAKLMIIRWQLSVTASHFNNRLTITIAKLLYNNWRRGKA